MRRIATAGVATVGLTSVLLVSGLGTAYAEPRADAPTDSGTASTSPWQTPPIVEPPTADSPAPADTPSQAETAASAEAAPVTDPGAAASTSQAVAPRRRADAATTIADVAAGRVVLRLGDSGPAVLAVQVRLKAAGLKATPSGTFTKETEKAVEHLQWKYLLDETGTVNRSTYRKLVSITAGRFTLPRPCRNPKAKLILCVDLKQRNLRYVKRGKTVWTIDIRSGMPSTPTRRGNWRVFEKRASWVSTLYGSPMPYSMFFSGGQAFHYSMFFDAVGYNGASHGCVNIGSMAQARWLFSHTPMGTPVKVY